MNRISVPLTLAMSLTMLLAAPVLAAPPTNDTYAGSEPIGALPFSTTVDTTEATTDADDAEWNAQCGAPATDASVWYAYTAASDDLIIANTEGSSFTPGVAIVVGAPGSFAVVACGPDAVIFETIAGETYQIVVFDDQFDGEGNGGTLVLSVDEAPPPPSIDVTVDPVARFNSRTGGVTVTGTVTCEGEADFTTIDLIVEQRVGRFVVRGFGSAFFTCDGTTQTWTADIFGDNGLFKGGKATSLTFAVACGVLCGEDFEEVTLKLRG